MNGIEIAEFIQCRSEIKHRIDTLEVLQPWKQSLTKIPHDMFQNNM